MQPIVIIISTQSYYVKKLRNSFQTLDCWSKITVRSSGVFCNNTTLY